MFTVVIYFCYVQGVVVGFRMVQTGKANVNRQIYFIYQSCFFSSLMQCLPCRAVYSRPPSSFFDSIRDSYDNADRLADDLTSGLFSTSEFADTIFLVGKPALLHCGPDTFTRVEPSC